MSNVYTDYFQKSKVFLYPLLKFKKGMSYVPMQTYVCWGDVYTPDDYMLLCEYRAKTTNGFKIFYNNYLKKHELFFNHIDMGNNKHMFIFNLKDYKYDFDRFMLGKYSQFSLKSKMTILDFFNSPGTMLNFVTAFLSPDTAHLEYAKELNVDIKDIIKIYEVCSILNLKKETFQDNNLLLDCLLNKNSISLEK
jgi:hypothetical protein